MGVITSKKKEDRAVADGWHVLMAMFQGVGNILLLVADFTLVRALVPAAAVGILAVDIGWPAIIWR